MARQWGRLASNTRGGHNKKLAVPQDYALKDYIFMLYRAGTVANLKAIQTAAGRLLYYALGDRISLVLQRWTKA